MSIRIAIDCAVIEQAREYFRVKALQIDTAGKVSKKIADGRFEGRLRQNQMREMIHGRTINQKGLLPRSGKLYCPAESTRI